MEIKPRTNFDALTNYRTLLLLMMSSARDTFIKVEDNVSGTVSYRKFDKDQCGSCKYQLRVSSWLTANGFDNL